MVLNILLTTKASDDPHFNRIYAYITGFYINTLLTPLIILALSTDITNTALRCVSFIGSTALVTITAGRVVYQIPNLAIQLGRNDTIWLLVVVPLTWTPVVFGVALSAIDSELSTLAVFLAFIGAISGLLAGVVLLMMSHRQYANSQLVGTEERARWEARRWPQRWRRIIIGTTVIANIIGFAGIVLSTQFGIEWAISAYALASLTIPLAIAATNTRTIRVMDAGLVVEDQLWRRFRPWSTFEHWALTDETLVVYSTGWKPSLRCARADIEDSRAAATVLESVFKARESRSTE
ncbi:hypothetical protein [Halocatena marina]|uniref:hypothetical protein n=1 Tax=Halocatena marina TaxID=2934937 RepID=UPI00200C05CB|nr:hypothetical protein [Halocatena marina]